MSNEHSELTNEMIEFISNVKKADRFEFIAGISNFCKELDYEVSNKIKAFFSEHYFELPESGTLFENEQFIISIDDFGNPSISLYEDNLPDFSGLDAEIELLDYLYTKAEDKLDELTKYRYVEANQDPYIKYYKIEL